MPLFVYCTREAFYRGSVEDSTKTLRKNGPNPYMAHMFFFVPGIELDVPTPPKSETLTTRLATHT